LGFIDQLQFDSATEAPIIARYHGLKSEVEGSYVAEMVRYELYQKYGDDLYRLGFRVTTTLNSKAQTQANNALQAGLLKYDRDHGLRTPSDQKLLTTTKLEIYENEITLTWPTSLDSEQDIDWPTTLDDWQEELNDRGQYGLLYPAVVAQVLDTGAWIVSGQKQWSWLPFSGVKWAKPYISVNRFGFEPTKTSDVLSQGQMIWVTASAESGLQLAQIPEAQGALISIDPSQGAIRALVGGFSYGLNKYNRAIQADRQPGSAFKPFIYSAALANGLTPASIINDAPVVFKDAGLENTWRPENSSGKFYGPTRLREALYKSQNLVSIRILKQIGPRKAINYISPFGFPREKLSKDLSLALGASAITPLELATGYTVLANGGFQIKPYFIKRIEVGDEEEPIFQANPLLACLECNVAADGSLQVSDAQSIQDEDQALLDAITNPLSEALAAESLASVATPKIKLAPRIMDERTHFIMNNMLQDVIKRGTGRRALALNRSDIAGKTGTTNDQKDAWFSGYNRDLVTSVWIGFDQPRSLGRWAFGGNTALPVWVDYMGAMLADKKQRPFPQPDGIVNVRIDPETGLLAQPGQVDAIFELFKREQIPAHDNSRQSTAEQSDNEEEENSPQLLF
jgi:penicillin-binding protein 1A